MLPLQERRGAIEQHLNTQKWVAEFIALEEKSHNNLSDQLPRKAHGLGDQARAQPLLRSHFPSPCYQQLRFVGKKSPASRWCENCTEQEKPSAFLITRRLRARSTFPTSELSVGRATPAAPQRWEALLHLFLFFAGRQIILRNNTLRAHRLLYSHLEQTDGSAKNLLL